MECSKIDVTGHLLPHLLREIVDEVPRTLIIDDSEIREALAECVVPIINATAGVGAFIFPRLCPFTNYR
jgi:hypothetical protein